MDDKLKEILESDFKYVLIVGDYFDCPSCNPTASFRAETYYDEKELLAAMLKYAGSERLEKIYVLDSYSGDMQHYCEIETKTGYHSVQSIELNLPENGKIIIHRDKEIGWVVADEAYRVLYGKSV